MLKEATQQIEDDHRRCREPEGHLFQEGRAAVLHGARLAQSPLRLHTPSSNTLANSSVQYAPTYADGTNTTVLLAGRAYAITVPDKLQQREKMFVGYAQPYLQIR